MLWWWRFGVSTTDVLTSCCSVCLFRLDLHLASTEEWNSDAIFYRSGTTTKDWLW